MITDQIMDAYREFMAGFIRQNGQTGLTIQMVEENLAWARQKIREEVLIAAYGVDMQRRITVETDKQIQRAIAEIPQAMRMANETRQPR